MWAGRRLLPWVFATLGVAAAATAAVLHPHQARSALDQTWSPFVLVAGLLLIGLVADDEGLFEWTGHQLSRRLRTGGALFVGSVVTISVVTALLNLDTSVAFVTPVLVYTARSRGGGEEALLYGCLLLSNAGSMFLPGSNLTNLIVLGHLHLTGSEFLAHMWLPGLAAVVSTAGVVAVVERSSLGVPRTNSSSGPASSTRPAPLDPLPVGAGLIAVGISAVLVVSLPTPAPWVAATGVLAAGVWARGDLHRWSRVAAVLPARVLTGLFGLAVALGTVGRVWSGPSSLLSHLDQWGTAAVGATSSVFFNNLPAASLLSARPPGHPFSLLIGLDVGPNLFVTGSLAWTLWIRAARNAGAETVDIAGGTDRAPGGRPLDGAGGGGSERDGLLVTGHPADGASGLSIHRVTDELRGMPTSSPPWQTLWLDRPR